MLEAYTQELHRRLEKLHVPVCLKCDDVHCDEPLHSRSSLLNINKVMIEPSNFTIRMSGGGSEGEGRASKGGLPGWQVEVEPFRHESRYWHNLGKVRGGLALGQTMTPWSGVGHSTTML